MSKIKREICEYCKTEFADKDALSEHTLGEHLLYESLVNPLYQICEEYNQLLALQSFDDDQCQGGGVSNKTENLETHLKTRVKRTNFQCGSCNKYLSNKYNLARHENWHITKTKKEQRDNQVSSKSTETVKRMANDVENTKELPPPPKRVKFV